MLDSPYRGFKPILRMSHQLPTSMPYQQAGLWDWAIEVTINYGAELKDFLEAGEALTRPWPPSFPIYYTPKDVRAAANG